MKWDNALNRYFSPATEEDRLLDDGNQNKQREVSKDIKSENMGRTNTPGIDANNNQNRISQGTKIVGDITSTGSFRIDGEFEGTIQSSGKIVVGESGVVRGTLNSAEVEIEGKIKGKLMVSDLLSLRSTARVDGEVTTSKLAVEPGATFNATCDMNSNANRSIKTLDGREKAEKPA